MALAIQGTLPPLPADSAGHHGALIISPPQIIGGIKRITKKPAATPATVSETKHLEEGLNAEALTAAKLLLQHPQVSKLTVFYMDGELLSNYLHMREELEGEALTKRAEVFLNYWKQLSEEIKKLAAKQGRECIILTFEEYRHAKQDEFKSATQQVRDFHCDDDYFSEKEKDNIRYFSRKFRFKGDKHKKAIKSHLRTECAFNLVAGQDAKANITFQAHMDNLSPGLVYFNGKQNVGGMKNFLLLDKSKQQPAKSTHLKESEDGSNDSDASVSEEKDNVAAVVTGEGGLSPLRAVKTFASLSTPSSPKKSLASSSSLPHHNGTRFFPLKSSLRSTTSNASGLFPAPPIYDNEVDSKGLSFSQLASIKVDPPLRKREVVDGSEGSESDLQANLGSMELEPDFDEVINRHGPCVAGAFAGAFFAAYKLTLEGAKKGNLEQKQTMTKVTSQNAAVSQRNIGGAELFSQPQKEGRTNSDPFERIRAERRCVAATATSTQQNDLVRPGTAPAGSAPKVLASSTRLPATKKLTIGGN